MSSHAQFGDPLSAPVNEQIKVSLKKYNLVGEWSSRCFDLDSEGRVKTGTVYYDNGVFDFFRDSETTARFLITEFRELSDDRFLLVRRNYTKTEMAGKPLSLTESTVKKFGKNQLTVVSQKTTNLANNTVTEVVRDGKILSNNSDVHMFTKCDSDEKVAQNNSKSGNQGNNQSLSSTFESADAKRKINANEQKNRYAKAEKFECEISFIRLDNSVWITYLPDNLLSMMDGRSGYPVSNTPNGFQWTGRIFQGDDVFNYEFDRKSKSLFSRPADSNDPRLVKKSSCNPVK